MLRRNTMSKQNNYANSRIWWLIRVVQIPLLTLVITLAGCETNKFIGAAAKGEIATVEDMLVEGADINQRGKNGRTALMAAASRGHKEMVQLLLAHGADVNAQSEGGSTALRSAASGNDCDIMRILLDEGADVDAKGSSGWTALIVAARNRCVEAVELLLEAGADVNARNNDGWTALMFATLGRRSSYDQMQSSRGAIDVYVTPDKKSIKMVEMLLSHDADPNAQEKIVEWSGWGIPPTHGRTALHIAAANFGMGANVKALLDHGADVNARDGNGFTALMRVAYRSTKQDIPTVKELLAHGADVTVRNRFGHTALSIARRYGEYEGSDEIERLIREALAAKDE
jgi:ankyrin repeat protein